MKHKCFIGFDADGAPEFSSEYTVVTYTPAEEPAELDAFAGTWVKGSQKYIFDGKGLVKNEDGNISTSYTINAAGKAVFSANGVDFTCTIKGDKLEVEFDDGEYQGTNTFTKQAEEAETLDAFAGNWKVYDTVFAFDGKGTVVVTGSSYDGTFSYTVSGDTVTFKNTRLNEVITCKLSGADAILVSCECGEEYSNTKFTKQ